MLSYVFIGITDFGRARAFYAAVMAELGIVLKFDDPERQWAGWMQPGLPRPCSWWASPSTVNPLNPATARWSRCLLLTDRRSTDVMQPHLIRARPMKVGLD